MTPEDNELLRSYLAGRSESCPSCRYDVRDLIDGRCPECGEELCLRLDVRCPRLAAIVTGIIGLSVCAGFGGIMMVLTLLLQDGPGGGIIVAIGAESAVAVILLVVWVHGYRRLRRRGALVRWSLAMVCWLPPVVQVVTVLIMA